MIKSINRYNYKELRKKALETNSMEDKMNLLRWFELYGSNYWNGEVYDLDDGWSLKPVYKGIGEPDEDGYYEEEELIDIKIN